MATKIKVTTTTTAKRIIRKRDKTAQAQAPKKETAKPA